jgi:uncharacterized membrane protein (UPF0127 family)
MRLVRVINRSRGQVLAERAELASSHWSRFWGLMGRRELPAGSGMVFEPGGAIHTCFMRLSIDVLHIGRDDRVTHVLRGIRPWRFGPLFVGGWRTVELPAGTAVESQPGDEIGVESLADTPAD